MERWSRPREILEDSTLTSGVYVNFRHLFKGISPLIFVANFPESKKCIDANIYTFSHSGRLKIILFILSFTSF